MGHYCWMCGRSRSNESFSGKGHKQHICKRCMQQPKAERDRVHALHDIQGYYKQRNISAKNAKHLKTLCQSHDTDVKELAALVLEVARVKSHRRKRLAVLRQNWPDLLNRLIQHGLEDDWFYENERFDPSEMPEFANGFQDTGEIGFEYGDPNFDADAWYFWNEYEGDHYLQPADIRLWTRRCRAALDDNLIYDDNDPQSHEPSADDDLPF